MYWKFPFQKFRTDSEKTLESPKESILKVTNTFLKPKLQYCLSDIFQCFDNLPPLSNVNWFYDPGNLVDKRDGSRQVVQYFDITNLFPRHGHILH